MISAEEIYAATEGGKSVILFYYPQSAAGFSGRKNFKMRPDDRTASGTVFRSKDGHWLIQDKGGADTQAYNAISLVKREQNLDYPQAIEWIAAKFAPQLLEEKEGIKNIVPQPDFEEVAPVDSISVQYRKDGTFTQAELAILGHNITPEVCAELCLKPLDSYITAKNEKGKSYRCSRNDNYPMYAYDYDTYGKIYQPLGKLRFLWYGSKEDKQAMPLSGEKDFMERYAKALHGNLNMEAKVKNDDGEEETVDLTWDSLIICSGPSDALNVKSAGYHVCWPNSETADLTEGQFHILSLMAKKIYILYDIDETGIRQMYKVALRYLDISIIRLPEELKEKRTMNGKPCKDAKDFFMYFRRPENQDPVRLFNELVKLSGGLKFWTVQQKNGSWKYDINNDQLYSFLEASGYFTIETSTNKEGFTFCRVVDNVVTLIDKDAIASECTTYCLEYLRTHPKYYSQQLVNSIHRSKQITAANLQRLRRIRPDFNAFTEEYDYLWFRNGIFRIGANGIEKVKTSDCPYMVYASKIIDHDFRPEKVSFFDIGYTPEYRAALDRLKAAAPFSPQYYTLVKEIDTIDDMKRYTLDVRQWGSTFMQYVWNTGRAYWRKEEAGFPLNELENAETRLNFIAKCLALGYMLCKFKNSGQPYAVYAMESEQCDEDEHLGGTGKSLFCSSIEKVRCQHYVDAQRMKEDKMQFFLQGVVRGVTDTVFMDDMNNSLNLHLFMNMVTGKMVVDVKHANPFTLEYLESPKLCWTSNHAIKNFDDSLNRRIWFAAFSDYYHSDSQKRGLKQRSPRSEFGKDLIDQYTPDEMNAFYNFMLNCMMMWHKIHERVQPPMKAIMQRTLIKSMTEDFFWWAEDWFTEARLNTYVDEDEAIDAYSSTLSKRSQDFLSKKKFKDKLKEFCQYHGWTFNPDAVFTSPSDKKANRIHMKKNGQDKYFFYIDTGVNSGDDLPLGGPGEPSLDMAPEPEDKAPF